MPNCPASASTLSEGRANLGNVLAISILLWYDINNVSYNNFVELLQRSFLKGRKVRIVPFLHFRPFSKKLSAICLSILA